MAQMSWNSFFGFWASVTLTTIFLPGHFSSEVPEQVSHDDNVMVHPSKIHRILTVSHGKEVRFGCPVLEDEILKEKLAGFDSVIWLFEGGNILIGSSVGYNRTKFRYQASSGDLIINEIEFKDQGKYRCLVSTMKDHHALNVRIDTGTVELVVTSSEEEQWNEKHYANAWRAGFAAAISLILICGFCGIYKYRWKKAQAQRNATQIGSDNPNLEVDLSNQRRLSAILEMDDQRLPHTHSTSLPALKMQRMLMNSTRIIPNKPSSNNNSETEN